MTWLEATRVHGLIARHFPDLEVRFVEVGVAWWAVTVRSPHAGREVKLMPERTWKLKVVLAVAAAAAWGYVAFRWVAP